MVIFFSNVPAHEKFGPTTRIKIVLESDGIEEYFSTLEKNTRFIVLKEGEYWIPPSQHNDWQSDLDQSDLRKFGVVVSDLNEMKMIAREKLKIAGDVKVFLTSDKTLIDEDYFRTKPADTCFTIVPEDYVFPADESTMSTDSNALQRIEEKLELLIEQRIEKKLEQLMEKLDKDHNRLADLVALFLVRNVSQLMVQVLNKINTRGQFKSSIFCPDQKGKKIEPSISQPLEPYTYEKYVKDKSDLVIIDKKNCKTT